MSDSGTLLTSTQRKYLRGLAHPLQAVVQLGTAGATAGLEQALNAALDEHELVKLRFGEHKDRRKELSAELATRCNAALAGVVGHVAIFYRAHADPEKRRIRLPRSA